LIFFLYSCAETEAPDLTHDFVAVSSKTESSVSIIDIDTDEVVKTEIIPNNGRINDIEFVVRHRKLFLSDSKNSKVLVYDPHAFVLQKTINFKTTISDIEADKVGRNLWVVHPLAKAISVIDASSQTKYKTIKLSSHLTENGGQPTKVMLSPEGEYAYILISTPNRNTQDRVVLYNTNTFEEIDSKKVGSNSVLHYSGLTDQLYALSSEDNRVVRFKSNLEITDDIKLSFDGVLGVNTRGSRIFLSQQNDVLAFDVESFGSNVVFSGRSGAANITTDFFDQRAFISFPDEDQVEIVDLATDRASMTVKSSLEVGIRPSSVKFFSIPGACAYHGHPDFYQRQ